MHFLTVDIILFHSFFSTLSLIDVSSYEIIAASAYKVFTLSHYWSQPVGSYSPLCLSNERKCCGYS